MKNISKLVWFINILSALNQRYNCLCITYNALEVVGTCISLVP